MAFSVKNSLFVRNLSPNVTESILREVFSSEDEIENVVFRAFPNQNNQFFAQIDFKTSLGVTSGVSLNGTSILGTACLVGVIDPLAGKMHQDMEMQKQRVKSYEVALKADETAKDAEEEKKGVEAEYYKRQKEEMEDQAYRTCHISGFDTGVTEEALKMFCEHFGDVEGVRVEEPEGLEPFALVEFKERGPAHVVKTQKEYEVDGKIVNFTDAKTMVNDVTFTEKTVHFQQPIFDAMNMQAVLSQQGHLNAKLAKVREAAMSIKHLNKDYIPEAEEEGEADKVKKKKKEKKEKKEKEKEKEKESPFDGKWSEGAISGTSLTFKSGIKNTIEILDGKQCKMTLRGKSYTGKLKDGKLHWSDGDVWTRDPEDVKDKLTEKKDKKDKKEAKKNKKEAKPVDPDARSRSREGKPVSEASEGKESPKDVKKKKKEKKEKKQKVKEASEQDVADKQDSKKLSKKEKKEKKKQKEGADESAAASPKKKKKDKKIEGDGSEAVPSKKRKKDKAADDEESPKKKKKKAKQDKKTGKMALETEAQDEEASEKPAEEEAAEKDGDAMSEESSSAPIDIDDEVDVVPNTEIVGIGFGSSSSSSSSSSTADPDELELLPDPDAVEHVETRRRKLCGDAVEFMGKLKGPAPMGSPALTTPGDISSTDSSDSSSDSPVRELGGDISDGEGTGQRRRPCIVPVRRKQLVRVATKMTKIIATAAVPIGLDEVGDGGAVASDDDIVASDDDDIVL